jgi:hypothetical protein
VNSSGRSRRSRSALAVTSSFAAPSASTSGSQPSSSGPAARAARPVDRPPVVRVDQRVLEQLGALVDVRHAGPGELQQLLAQRVDQPGA